MASSLFFPSLNNIYSDYFAFLADGEASGFFSARPVMYQPYIGAKKKKFIFTDTATSRVNRPNNNRLQPIPTHRWKEDEIVADFQRQII